VRILPLRIIDQPGGPVIRCLCGAEAAVIRAGLSNSTMTGLRGSGPALSHAGPDLTPAAVMRMVLHAKGCARAEQIIATVTG
jgi:hypothetical protein